MEGAISGDDSGIVRFQSWQRAVCADDFTPARQYGYRADAGLGVREITAAGDDRLLVLERGFTAGVGNTVAAVPRRLRAGPATCAASRT